MRVRVRVRVRVSQLDRFQLTGKTGRQTDGQASIRVRFVFGRSVLVGLELELGLG